MTEQLIYELNGIRYLLVELPITSGNNKNTVATYTKYDGIYQGVKDIKRAGLFYSGLAIIKVLIPERNIVEFNKEITTQ